MLTKSKLKIGKVVNFPGKKTVVISFIPNRNKYLLVGFGSPVKLENIQIRKQNLLKYRMKKKSTINCAHT